jgi:hypothetical protein
MQTSSAGIQFGMLLAAKSSGSIIGKIADIAVPNISAARLGLRIDLRAVFLFLRQQHRSQSSQGDIQMRLQAWNTESPEPFYPGVDSVNINDNYVLFSDGSMVTINTYLDFEETVVDDGAEASSCWVEHPKHGWLQVDIYEDAPTFN